MTPLQIAAAAGQLAGAACDMFLDWLAPLPEEASWPDGEQPIVDPVLASHLAPEQYAELDRAFVDAVRNAPRGPLRPEPAFTADEITGLRQLLDERFGLALAETAANLASVEPMPAWYGGSEGFNQTTENRAAPANFPGAGAAQPNVTAALLISAAIGLREYADSNSCEAPTYWRNVADQLDPK